MRCFFPGMVFSIDQQDFRVMTGYKGEGDLRLEFRTGGNWRPVSMAQMAMMFQFFVENERRLFSQRPHWKVEPQEYIERYLEQALRSGWWEATEEFINKPRRNRDEA